MDWYRKHGTADERLKSYYYQGRVYQNAGDNEAAMGSFVRAEAYAGQSDDKTAAGLLYLAMSNISMDIFDMDKVLEYSSDAEKIFKETEDTARYSSSLLKVCTYYSIQEDYEKAVRIIPYRKITRRHQTYWTLLPPYGTIWICRTGTHISR